jgi:UDP-2,3-diacylglucosamine pyrophosphatase LpxH
VAFVAEIEGAKMMTEQNTAHDIADDTADTSSIERASDDCLIVRYDDWFSGAERWHLLISDVHWDNPHCDRDLFHKLMKQAKERDARVSIFGDFFCAMQGKADKRSDKSSLRPEHQGSNYFDLLVDTAVDDIAPYRAYILEITDGNHETAVRKNHEIDLVERLCKQLGVYHGGYSGFIKFLFSRGKSGKASKTLFYHHGSGGGGVVTKGVIQTNRRAVWLPDADIIVSGHVHESWVMELPRQRLSATGQTYFDTQYHIQLATFKQEHTLSGGWHIERGAPPKPLGGWWLRWYFDSSKWGNVGMEIIRAS